MVPWRDNEDRSFMLKYVVPALCLLVGSVLAAVPALAQFAPPGLPSPELIRNADTYDPPLLTDYAAKLAQQPDMTGLWVAMQPVDAGAGPTFDPVNTFWPKQPVPGESLFGPIPGTYLKGIPYNAEWQARYDLYVKEALAGKSRDPFAACRPYGVPRMIGDSPVPFDIIQSPEVMFWYNDYGRSERRIFMDGRAHPTEPTITGEFGPTYSGHSIGHWEGNTLVVDTVDIIEGNYDETSAPYSDKLSMVERMRLIDTNTLEIQMTFSDPVAFVRPWVVTRYFTRIRTTIAAEIPASQVAATASPQPIPRDFKNLNDRPCVPNIALDENGYQVIILPQELEKQTADKKKAAPPKQAR
jgi:hypothetical protein